MIISVLLLLELLLVFKPAQAAPPPTINSAEASSLTNPATNLTVNPLHNPQPEPYCYPKVRLDKPRLNLARCENVWKWMDDPHQNKFRTHIWNQEGKDGAFPIPPKNPAYVGCVVTVYSRIPGAQGAFTISSVELAARNIIYQKCRGNGRGGKSEILDAPMGIVPGWYVKVEAKYNHEDQPGLTLG